MEYGSSLAKRLKNTIYKLHELESIYSRITFNSNTTSMTKITMGRNIRLREEQLKKAERLVTEMKGIIPLDDIINMLKYSRNMLDGAKREYRSL